MSKYEVYEPFIPLTDEILKYLIPFRKLRKTGFPMELETMKEWNSTLDKMIFAFKAIKKDNPNYSFKHWKRIEEGLNLFSKYFPSLWD